MFSDITKSTFSHNMISHEPAMYMFIQWNLDLTKCQGTGEIGSLYRGFIISSFFSIRYTISWLKNVVRYTEDFVI